MMPLPEPVTERQPAEAGRPSPETLLVEGLRRGDRGASHRFFREYYPRVYRYLCWLTRHPETAADLAQETFIRAWRFLDQFDGRGPLRVWLHRIAHREFLRYLRSRHAESSLEEAPEVAARTGAQLDAVELRDAIRKLPTEEGEVVLLHYLEGYECEEIALIVGAPSGTVKYRLSRARAHLRRELGEDDLAYLNESPLSRRSWVWPPLEQMRALELRLADRPSSLQPEDHRMPSDKLSRRDLLTTAAGAGAAALAAGAPGAALATGNEADVIDERLTRKLTLAFKATALVDLCAHLSAETGVKIVAGASVADEKATLFCKQVPLREVMRQLSRPFGYTWVRSAKGGKHQYELTQDLQSQLMEEELRNRDRHAALLVLEKEIERYRPYLDLSPDEAFERAKTEPAAEKALLQKLGGKGWGPIQMYFRLTPPQQAALRAGRPLHFSQMPKTGEPSLPSEIARGVQQSLRDVFFFRLPEGKEGFGVGSGITDPGPEAIRPSALPEARADVDLFMRENELGHIALSHSVSTYAGSRASTREGDGTLALGISPAVAKPDNRAANARLARDPELRKPVTVETVGSCRVVAEEPADDRRPEAVPSAAEGTDGRRATSADVLEAVHRATGLPVVGDFYTKLYAPDTLSVRDQPLFDALSQVADAIHSRWNRDGEWLQFRSASYYDDRLKEVPNRLLTKWSASRKRHGALPLDDVVEIAALTDAQLDASGMAEGAIHGWGLQEWRLFDRNSHLRPHLRFLGELTPAQRQEAMGPSGLLFAKLSLAQQQRFIALALRFDDQPLTSLDELNGAAMRVDYTQPGGFVWRPPAANWYEWTVPIVPGQEGRRALLPACRGRSREEALAAARRLDHDLLEAILPEASRLRPEVRSAATVPDAGPVTPTRLDLAVIYVPGLSNRRNISIVNRGADMHLSTW